MRNFKNFFINIEQYAEILYTVQTTIENIIGIDNSINVNIIVSVLSQNTAAGSYQYSRIAQFMRRDGGTW